MKKNNKYLNEKGFKDRRGVVKMIDVSKTKMDNYNWFVNHDFKNYAGQWVAIANKKVIGSDKNVKKLMEKVKAKPKDKGGAKTKVKAKPKEEPVIAKIPKNKEVLIL